MQISAWVPAPAVVVFPPTAPTVWGTATVPTPAVPQVPAVTDWATGGTGAPAWTSAPAATVTPAWTPAPAVDTLTANLQALLLAATSTATVDALAKNLQLLSLADAPSNFDTDTFELEYSVFRCVTRMMIDRGAYVAPDLQFPTINHALTAYVNSDSGMRINKSFPQFLSRYYAAVRREKGQPVTVDVAYVAYETLIENENAIGSQQASNFIARAKGKLSIDQLRPLLPPDFKPIGGPSEVPISSAVLVTSHNLTAPAMNNFSTFRRGAGYSHILRSVHHFTYDDLLSFRIDHVNLPVHRLIPRSLKAAKLEEMRTKAVQAPIMNIDEPVAKYYGFVKGDLVEIVRNDAMLALMVTYNMSVRIVF